MIIFIDWEGRGYHNDGFKADMSLAADQFGLIHPVWAHGYDMGMMITDQMPPDFTKVRRVRNGQVRGNDGTRPPDYHADWTTKLEVSDLEVGSIWMKAQDPANWIPHANITALLWTWWMLDWCLSDQQA